MLALALLLFGAGAGIGVHLEDVEEVAPESAARVLDALGKAIEARTGTAAVIDNPVWSACETGDRCLDAVRARTGADDLVLVKLFGGPKSTFIAAERIAPSLREPRSAKLTIEGELAGADLGPLAQDLFPEPRKPRRVTAGDDGVLPHPAESKSLGPWIVLGASAALAGGAAYFAAGSAGAKNQRESEFLSSAESDALYDRQRTQAIAAGALLTAAIAGAATAVIWWLMD